jgi:putative ABC transport system permease protein
MARLGRSGTLVRLSRCASAPAFSVAVVLLLGVCAGAVGLVSGVARDLLLRRLPYADPDRLVVMKQVPPRAGVVEDLRAAALFDRVEAYAEWAANVGTPGQVERALIARVTSGFLSLSTGSPRLGRPLLSHDFSYSATPVALITYDVWRHRYGATPDVLGATVAIDGQLHEIVGVLPEEFRTVDELERLRDRPFERRVVALVPLLGQGTRDRWASDRVERGLTIVARLRDSVTLERSNRDLAPVLDRLSIPGATRYRLNTLTALAVRDLPVRLAALSSAMLLLLVVGGANLIGLIASRADGRSRELSVRAALGATPRRLAGEMVAEIMVLAAAGAAVGLWIAAYGIQAMNWLAAGMLDLEAASLDWVTPAVVVLLSLGMSLVAALWAVRRRLGVRTYSLLGDQSVATPPRKVAAVLLGVQVAIAVALVIAVSALAGAIAGRGATSLGFRAEGVLTAEISLNRAKYLTAANRFFTDLLNRLSGVPGLRDVALVSNAPAGTVFGGGLIKVHGRAEWVDVAQVSSGYFSLLGIPVVNGRFFDETDTATSPRVTVVNETFARHYWGDPVHALGRVFAHGELSRTNSARTVTVVEDIEWTVVGVVSDVRDGAFGATIRPKFYTNYLQNLHGAGRSQMTILARASSGDGSALAPSLLQAARSVDPDQPLYNVLPLTRILSSRWAAERALTSVMSAFALVALIVAALGVFAAASAAAAKGRREVGIRLALGGTRTAVLRALLGREGKAVLLGLWFGALAGFLGVSTLRALVSVSTDLSVASVAGAVLFVAVVTAIALIVPAWRATQLDPSVVLRVS